MSVDKGQVSRTGGFWLTILSVGVVAIGGGVQQSSFYGFAAFLPAKYTQALMFGESFAGVLVSFNRIWTKASYGDKPDANRDSTFLFFYVSIAFILCCAVLHEIAIRSVFSQHHSGRHSQPLQGTNGTNNPVDDAESLLTPEDGGGGDNNGDSSGNSNSSGRGGGEDAKDDSGVAELAGDSRRIEAPTVQRKRVAKMIVRPMAAVAGSFIVTLSVFPGVTTAVSYAPCPPAFTSSVFLRNMCEVLSLCHFCQQHFRAFSSMPPSPPPQGRLTFKTVSICLLGAVVLYRCTSRPLASLSITISHPSTFSRAATCRLGAVGTMG
jgi:hypothetical protein